MKVNKTNQYSTSKGREKSIEFINVNRIKKTLIR